MNPNHTHQYNPTIRLVEQDWTGSLQRLIESNRPFLSDEFVNKLTRELAQAGKSELNLGSGVTFHFEVV